MIVTISHDSLYTDSGYIKIIIFITKLSEEKYLDISKAPYF